jgi:hypothetical protein
MIRRLKRMAGPAALLMAIAALWLGFAAPADAQAFIDMNWSGCFGVAATVTNVNYTTAANYDLYISAIGLDAAPGELYWGHDVSVLIGPNLPDAWRFDPAGCETTNFVEVGYLNTGVAGCGGLRNGEDVPINTYTYDAITGVAEIEGSDAYAAAGGRLAVPTTTYLLYRFRFPLDESICAGTAQKICFAGKRNDFAVGTEPATAHLYNPPWRTVWASFNDDGNTLPCPAVPTNPSTWGRLKGLYR